MKNYTLGKPKKEPRWFKSLVKRVEKDFGHCSKRLNSKDWCFSCVVCRMQLAISIIRDSYGIGERTVKWKKKASWEEMKKKLKRETKLDFDK